MKARRCYQILLISSQATRNNNKDQMIKPLKEKQAPTWQYSSGGSSLSKKKINKRTMELLKGD